MQAEPAANVWHGWLRGLEGTGIAVAVRESAWLYPAVETLHIIGIIVLVGAAAIFDLRVLGVSPRVPVEEAARHLLPCSRAALLLVVPTGLLLFASHAPTVWANPAFRVKLALLATAGVNAYMFHRRPFWTVQAWNRDSPPPAGAKVHAAFSLAIWAGVVTCGRLIAYF